MAIKIKQVRLEPTRPPQEIRGNTTLRRAWLAAEVVRRQETIGVTAKIVGQGSYQQVSATMAVPTAGRLRHRGHCQFCGHKQVVKDGVLVTHGYSRPGYGYIFNECPGHEKKPLEFEKALTESWLVEATAAHADWAGMAEGWAPVEKAALTAMYDGSAPREPHSHRDLPRRPMMRAQRETSVEENETYLAKMKAWAAQYPLHNAYCRAQKDHTVARDQTWKFKQRKDHFQYLLDMGVHGKPLIEEVV